MLARLLVIVLLAIASRSFAHPPADLSAAPRDADAAIETDARIDPATGRLAATWPKPRPFDHLHMRLELDIPDINAPLLGAVMNLKVRAVGKARSTLRLDCRGPQVVSVELGGAQCGFRQDAGVLTIDLPRPISRDSEAEVTVRYTLDFSANKGEGLTFSPAKADAANLTEEHPQIHAQGQAELNSLWFPCHDHPNERLTTELVVTVADGYQVVSNGRLLSATQQPGGRTRWHWSQQQPHAPYLVTLAIGRFTTVDLGGDDSARPGLPIIVYAPHGSEENVQRLFSDTPRMIAFFEYIFDEPYPWDQYAQVIVRDFAAGGMENTSATLLTLGSLRGEAGAQDDLISHELAHQWFGDLVTCRSWDHLWLNEGFASYSEALWAEHKAADQGPEAARAAYLKTIRGYVRSQRARNKGSAPYQPALVSNLFSDPDKTFGKADDPYAKGTAILHMLRCRLGDETFFKGLRLYLDRFKFSEVETDDFRRVMEEVSGQSLERFFTQWCLRPGLPSLNVTTRWDSSTRELTVKVRQTQRIDVHNPAYAFTLPVHVRLEGGGERWIRVDCDSREASLTVTLDAAPEKTTVDPNFTVLARLETENETAPSP